LNVISAHQPPKDIPASQLWMKLQELPRPSKVVDFPRKAPDGTAIGQLSIRVLTQEEQMAAHGAAERVTQAILKDGNKEQFGYERLYADAAYVEILFRACRDLDDPNRTAFPSPKTIREVLTTEECAALFQHYLTVQLELGPVLAAMSDEEKEAWIDRLVEGGSAFPFDLLSSDLQKILLLYMGYQLRLSPKDKSSVGSPPEETPDEEVDKPRTTQLESLAE
jgi:hypothetical protein